MNGSIKLYNLLLEKNFSKEEAEAFVNELDVSLDSKVEKFKDIIVTKEDLHKAVERLSDTANRHLMWMLVALLGQVGLIFLILHLAGVFD